MFTGLIETVGRIVSVTGDSEMKKIRIDAPELTALLRRGDSVSVDGVCQTVTETSGLSFSIDAMEATIRKTTFRYFRAGDRVNLEKSLTPSSPLGGHFVQGHVSGTGIISDIVRKNSNTWLAVSVDKEITDYCIPEGSIAIDGISLTISSLENNLITVNVIPETLSGTTLGLKNKGDRVNIETDMIGRYIATILSKYGFSGPPPACNRSSGNGETTGNEGLTLGKMEKWGY